jgi:hypothetical protein
VTQRTSPPYALARTTFRFTRLAALAGGAPLGGERESLLAAFVAARLLADATGAVALSDATRTARATAARSWIGSLNIASQLRGTVLDAISASAGDDDGARRTAVEALVAELGVDGRAARELAGAVG